MKPLKGNSFSSNNRLKLIRPKLNKSDDKRIEIKQVCRKALYVLSSSKGEIDFLMHYSLGSSPFLSVKLKGILPLLPRLFALGMTDIKGLLE